MNQVLDRPIAATFFRHQYAILLFTLLLVYGIRPFVGDRLWILAALQIATLLMMGTAVAAFWKRRAYFVAAVLLGVSVQALQSVHRFTSMRNTGVAGQVVELIFFLVIISAIAGHLLRTEKVTLNTVFGVCAIYLLMATAWSNVYITIEMLDPDSFSGGMLTESSGATDEQKESDLLYFSLITMTTVGYGDITPSTQPTRSLSALQGLIGQLFLATVVARIVSMEIGDRMAARKSKHRKEGG